MKLNEFHHLFPIASRYTEHSTIEDLFVICECDPVIWSIRIEWFCRWFVGEYIGIEIEVLLIQARSFVWAYRGFVWRRLVGASISNLGAKAGQCDCFQTLLQFLIILFLHWNNDV